MKTTGKLEHGQQQNSNSVFDSTVCVSKIRRATLKGLIGSKTKMDDFILFPVKSSYIFWYKGRLQRLLYKKNFYGLELLKNHF